MREMYKAPSGNTEPRIQRLYRHLLEQRHYYPLYPPPLDSGCFLDIQRTFGPSTEEKPNPCDLSIIPDILIVPSKLKASINTVHPNCLVLNPGRLVMGKGSGTFSRLYVHGLDTNYLKQQVLGDEMESEESEERFKENRVYHLVAQRCRGEIVRL